MGHMYLPSIIMQIVTISFFPGDFMILYCLFYFIWFDLRSQKAIINKELSLQKKYNLSYIGIRKT